jgi:hypothetical protein
MNLGRQLKWWSRRRDGELAPHRAARLDRDGLRPAVVDEAETVWKGLGDHLRNQAIPTPPAEVMWNDVRREIRRHAPEHWAEQHLKRPWDWATTTAIAIFMVLLGFFSLRISMPPEAHATEPRVAWVDAELPGATAMVYEDEQSGAVVIWMVTPADAPADGGKS